MQLIREQAARREAQNSQSDQRERRSRAVRDQPRYRTLPEDGAEKPYLLDMTPLSDSGHSTSAYAHKKSPHTASCAVKVCAALSGARMVVSSSQQAVMA